MKNLHSILMPDITYTCDVCSQAFDDLDELQDHMSTNHATKTEVVQEGEQK